MKLSTRGRYSIRIMLELAKNYYHENNAVIELNKVAKAQGLSLKYIEHIVSDLKKQGLVASIRGVGGGYKLTKSPDKISIFEILQASENISSIVKCIHKKSSCSCLKLCSACEIWEGIQKAIVDYLKTKKLIDIVRTNEAYVGKVIPSGEGNR